MISNNFKLRFSIILSLILPLSVNILAWDYSSDVSIRIFEKLKSSFGQGIEIMKDDSISLLYHSSNNAPNLQLESEKIRKMIVPIIGKYNKTTKEQITKIVPLKTPDKVFEFLKIIYINDQIHLFTGYNDKKQKKYFFYDETLNDESLEMNNDKRIIMEISMSQMSGAKKFGFNFSHNENDKNIEIFCWYTAGKGIIKEFFLFDNNLHLVSNICINENPSNVYTKYHFDKAGNLYILSESFNDKNGYALKSKSDKLFANYFPKDGSTPTIKEISIENQKISSPSFNISNENEFVCVGIFSNLNRRAARGVFSCKYSTGLKDSISFYKAILDKGLVTSGMSNDAALKLWDEFEKGKEYDNNYFYLLSSPIYCSDGSFYIIVEKGIRNIISSSSMRSSGISGAFYTEASTSKTDTWGDLYILECTRDGSFKWFKKICRKRTFDELKTQNGSYKFALGKDDNLHLIFSQKTITEEESKNSKAEISLYTISKSGNIGRKSIFKDELLSSFACILYSRSFDDGKFVLPYINSMFTINSFSIAEFQLY